MRDRLIELLDDYMGNEFSKNDGLADYLLANGVIVPPCKVGDVLWIPSVNLNKVYSKVVKEILIQEKDDEVGMYVYASFAYFPFENIGKTVFLTREEAEQALKERATNNDRADCFHI